ncbi:hypothetical protein COCNU_02G011570 [Cocos nucifera]|uniref:Uncharacterized protein n=1 Tax=Cocos nucifera TaxID=13894 RepID=A0A8K0MXH5_COCNU|nr:hypothetical protein COCNU_02G011570 [Cocos nucifera]
MYLSMPVQVHACLHEQKFLIGLVLMVPVYAVESVAFICKIMRDCYEPFAMYCFGRYLIACLGSEVRTIEHMETQSQISSSSPLFELEYLDGAVRHPFPLNCFLKHWHLGSDFYDAVKTGIVQYMILKTICALLAILLEFIGAYGGGKFEWRYGVAYILCAFAQVVDDLKFTVSHVVKPVEQGLAKINETFHQISENKKQYEGGRTKGKDDSYIIPMHSCTNELYDLHDCLSEGSISDSRLESRRHQAQNLQLHRLGNQMLLPNVGHSSL